MSLLIVCLREVPLFRPVNALAIMGGCAAAPISIHEPRPSFATSQSSSTTVSMATLAQILQQNPGLVLSPAVISSSASQLQLQFSSKPVNTDNLFVAPTPSDASFKPVVHKFLQPSPRPSVEPVAKKSTFKSLRKTEALASCCDFFIFYISCPTIVTFAREVLSSVRLLSCLLDPASLLLNVLKRRKEEPEAIYFNEEDVEEAVIELLSDEYKPVSVSSAKRKVIRPPSRSPSPDQQASMPGRHHLLASSEIVDVRDFSLLAEKISYNELNLLRADNMLAGACSFCASLPVKSSLCEKAICGDGSHDNCALCSANGAKCQYLMRGEEAALHAEVAAYQGQVSQSGLASMTLHAIVNDLYLALSDYQLTHGTEWLANDQLVSKATKDDSKVHESMPLPAVVNSPTLDDSPMIVDNSNLHRRSFPQGQPEEPSMSLIPLIAVLGASSASSEVSSRPMTTPVNPMTIPPGAASISAMVAVSSPMVVPSPPSTPSRIKVSGPMDHWVHKTPRSHVVKSRDGSLVSTGPRASSM
ncbi:hypothetical protein C8J56DRAFT_894311 [Mycena floridula]|nr:hypothetical protein C8J56DRAFT_894311 [Mycena floridula]